MNILITTEYLFGNPDLVTLSVELVKRGHQVNVITSHPHIFNEYGMPNAVAEVNIFEANPHIDIPNLPYTVSFPAPQVTRLIKSRDIEVCHTVMEMATHSATVAFVSKALGVPYVHTIQGTGTKTGRQPVDMIADLYNLTVSRLIISGAERVIVLSKSLSARAIELGANPEKIDVIPSGVDTSRFDPSKNEVAEAARIIRDSMGIRDGVVIGYVGRLVPVKGLKYLLLAMRGVQQKCPDAHLLVVGDGFQKAELMLMAKQQGLNITFIGWRNEVVPLYAVADIFVLPSLEEGLSNSLLEAMAMEKPIVTTNVGGNKDVVIDRENGFLVPPHDSASLASKIVELIESPSTREKMGRLNREAVKKNYSWENCVSKVQDVYKDLISARK